MLVELTVPQDSICVCLYCTVQPATQQYRERSPTPYFSWWRTWNKERIYTEKNYYSGGNSSSTTYL